MSEQAKLPEEKAAAWLYERIMLERNRPELTRDDFPDGLYPEFVENWLEQGRQILAAIDLPAIIAQRDSEWRSGLLGDEARQAAGRAAFEDFDPDGAWEALDEPLRLTWEGNTAAGIEAAIDKGAPDGGRE